MKMMTFQARELREALAQVRQKLGPDALIVSTRQVTPLLGLGRPLLEVTAALPEGPAQKDPEPKGRGVAARLLNRVQGKRAYGADLREGAEEEAWFAEPGEAPAAAAEAPPREEGEDGGLLPLQREVRALKSQLQQMAQSTQGAPALRQEVEELRALVQTLGAKNPADLTPETARLVTLGVERKRAEGVIARAREIGGDARDALRKALMERVVAAGPVGVSARVAAFIGPTGVGKTTTIAKIAARAALMDGAKVALITIDTFRVGAIDQLQRYADLMELPLHVAGTSVALRAAVQSNAAMDLILVDTAGRGPRDVAQLAALRELLGGGDGLEVHLCLSATTRAREQSLAIQSYRPLRPSRLCITKLDEAVSLGEVLNLHEVSRLPISYFGVGQRVPEDLELCAPETFVQRLLSAPLVSELDGAQKGAVTRGEVSLA